MFHSLRECVLRLLPVAMIGSACVDSGSADLVLRGGKIATVDSVFSIHQAVAVKDGRFFFVGSNEGVEQHIGRGTHVIALNGKLVTPGMVDAHGHPFNLGNVDEPETFTVRGSSSWDEVVARVAAQIETMEAGEWLIGGGWYQDDWEDNTIPEHDGLSAVSPQNPVFLYRRGGNSAFVNAKALEIAGIDENTPDPYGGVIGRKADGTPSGFLVNMGNNIEHAELITPEDVPRFVELGVVPSVQPIHHTSDMEFLVHRLGPVRARSYASPNTW